MTGAFREPLVSIGVPVRNGGATLAQALGTVVAQTYRNLEIIISDNGSTDNTSTICGEFAQRDARVRSVRQPMPLNALQNFRYLFEASRGAFFMWAAHDDLRSENYVDTLLRGFVRVPNASLCFSEVREFERHDRWQSAAPVDHDFETVGLGFPARVRKQTRIGCTHVYGLLNAAYLREYPWYDIEDGPDVAMLLWLGTRGPLVREPGATFYYHRPPGRDAEMRARETNYGRLKPFHKERLAWLCAVAVEDAARRSGAPIGRLRAFPRLYLNIVQGLKGLVFTWLPPAVRAALRRRSARRLSHATVG